jgi:hypothetical protein
MLDELRSFGAIRWAVAYTMEGKACRIVHGTIDDVAKFLAREDQAGFSVEEWIADFSNEGNREWSVDEDGHPFELHLLLGEIAEIRVTRITGDDVRNLEDLRQVE